MTDNLTQMTEAQVRDFLHAPRHAIVATNRGDGSIQLSPVWYLYEEGCLYIAVFVDSVKYRNLRRDPRISVCIDGGHPDARAVMLYGTVEIIDEDSAWREKKRWDIMRRYFDDDGEARSYMQETAEWGPAALIVVKPDKTIAADYNEM